MDHRSDAHQHSRLTLRGVSLALSLVGASLALAVVVRGLGGADTAPSPSSTAPLSASSRSPVTRWVSSISSAPSSSTTAPAAVETPPAAPLTIQGAPTAGVNYDSPYSFAPTVSGPPGPALAFTIQNKPAWAAFDSSNGALTGTPGVGDVGTDANIVIGVTDGTASASLPPFSISVNEVSNGTATLTWSGVTRTFADTALGDVAGYIVYYGTSADNLNQQVKLANPGLTSYMLTNLASATWYFAVAAYTRDGVVGRMSGVGQKTIP